MQHYATSTHYGTQQNQIYHSIDSPMTHKYPCAMPFHSHGTLPAHSTPPFFPSNQPNNYIYTANARQSYIRAYPSRGSQVVVPKTALQYYTTPSSKIRKHISSNINYHAPMDSSMRTHDARNATIGYSIHQPLPLISTKNVDKNSSNRAVRRCRSGGYMVPKKVQMRQYYQERISFS